MTTILIAFLMAFAAALALTRASIPLAFRFGFVDRPDGGRKLHTRPTPRMGGVAIFLAFALPLALVLLFRERTQVARVVLESRMQLLALLGGAFLALVLGLIDDRRDLRPAWKLLGQAAIGAAAYAAGFQINRISLPLGPPLELGALGPVLTVLWFVGCMNAVNLLDGLDGLAAGACLFVSLCLLLVSLHFGNVLGMLLMAGLSGAILGFLVFNFPPARIFLGDCGSMLLGYAVAALSLVGSSRKAEAAVALFIPIVALGLPITDTAVVIFRRWYKRLPLSTPDRRHIHHSLVAMGYSQRRTVLILYGISVLLGGSALVITLGRSEVILILMGSLALITFVAMRVFSGVRLSDLFDRLASDAARRRAVILAQAVEEQALRALAAAADWQGVWRALREAAAELRLRRVDLSVRRPGPSAARTWSGATGGGDGGPPGDLWEVRLAWRSPGGAEGRIGFAAPCGDHPYTELLGTLSALRDGVAARADALPADGLREAAPDGTV